jgi:uncharacterized protein YgiB involved in biofilm formation
VATTRTCTKKYSNGSCQTYAYTTAPYEAWNGCVEARPYPYNDDDTTPTSGTPASLFVPILAGLLGMLADQLDLYRRHSTSWSLWMYKDIGRQGLVSVLGDAEDLDVVE